VAKDTVSKAKDRPGVYILHGPADFVEARHLRNHLVRETGIQAVLSEDVGAKPKPLASLRQELHHADIVVVLLTPSAVECGPLLEQLGAAWALEKQIVPVFTERSVLNGLPQSVVQSPWLTEVTQLSDSASETIVRRVRQVQESLLIAN